MLRLQAQRDASRSTVERDSFRDAAALSSRLRSVGIFSLLVGAAVRLRRPDNQATLHFFWLCVAFFGMLAFSFTGRLDTLDWVFYWGDVDRRAAAAAALRALRARVPRAPRQLGAERCRPQLLPLLYLPALAARRCATSRRCCAAATARPCTTLLTLVERGELMYLAVSLRRRSGRS